MSQLEFPVTKQSTVAYINECISYFETETRYYKNKSNMYRYMSWINRIAAIVLFSIGVILPVFSGGSYLSIAYSCLLLSGILILVDQVFVHTDSWMIYKSAATTARSIIDDIRLYRVRYIATVATDAAAHEAVDDSLSKLEEAHKLIHLLRSTTDASFATKLLEGRAALERRISEATPEARELAQKEEERSRVAAEMDAAGQGLTGGLQLEIANPEEASSLTITIDGELHEWEPGRRSQVFRDLKPGHVIIGVNAKLKDESQYIVDRVARIIGEDIIEKRLSLPH